MNRPYLHAIHQNHVRRGGAMTHLARLAIFLAVEPFFRAIHGREFEDDDPFWLPVALEHFGFAATDNVFAALGMYARRRLFLILLVTDGVGHFDFNNYVSRHGGKDEGW